MAEDNPTDYEEVLMQTVNEIWSKYDTDANDKLDVSEMRKFVNETLRESGNDKEISDEEFESLFAQVD